MTADVRHVIDHSILCWLATAGEDGMPNVSPKEVFVADGDTHLLIADIASSESVKRLHVNANACVCFIDVFVQKGYKLSGRARVVAPEDGDYGRKVARLLALSGPLFPIRHVIEIEVATVAPVITPRYRLYPETTEAEQIARALQTYGVTPRLTPDGKWVRSKQQYKT